MALSSSYHAIPLGCQRPYEWPLKFAVPLLPDLLRHRDVILLDWPACVIMIELTVLSSGDAYLGDGRRVSEYCRTSDIQ